MTDHASDHVDFDWCAGRRWFFVDPNPFPRFHLLRWWR